MVRIDGDAFEVDAPSRSTINVMVREYGVKPTKGRTVWTCSEADASVYPGCKLTWNTAGFTPEQPTLQRPFVGFRPIIHPAGDSTAEMLEYLNGVEDGSVVLLGGIEADGVIVSPETVLTGVKSLAFVNTPIEEELCIPFRKMHFWLFAEVPICLGLSFEELREFGFVIR